ncbi:MAG TPA: methylated DNA-protein cysteine methyltransferase [Cytophagales bacterium]|nr:methylated DNA-protein cysteine methyltransferase [Cytophagales bacterium]HAA19686.1 methylated DNA-protein cysteine methyltransferase [Cytophagales bacterium]HAP61653.1 methylated DNA-protein cysteine methyltransferase [Cytophagales bacterium]
MENEMIDKRATWRDKLRYTDKPVIKPAPEHWARRYGGHKMVIATPELVEEKIRLIPKGQLSTIGIIRKQIAKDFKVNFSCPLTTGIFVRIVGELAEEARSEGSSDIAPWWRVLKDDGTFSAKNPGHPELQTKYLEEDGLEVVPKGKNHITVKDFEQYLVKA